MHIPDGFLATPVWLGLDAMAVPIVAATARRAERQMEEVRAPLLGVMGAFVFAAQMVNFPVGVGTSGHLVGSALLTITLGPAAASIVMTAILAIQALVFQDGGILALGANTLNMAFTGVLAAYLPYQLLRERGRRTAAFVAAAFSVFLSAAMAIAELLVSGVRIPRAALLVSTGLFAVSAVIEGAITVAVVESVGKLSPRLIRQPAPVRSWALAGIALTALVLASAGVLVASASPDGVQKLASAAGISGNAVNTVAAPLADYQVRWLGQSWVAKSAAGVVGLALAGSIAFVLGARRKR